MSFEHNMDARIRLRQLAVKRLRKFMQAVAGFAIGMGVTTTKTNGAIFLTTADDQASVINGLAYGGRTVYLGVNNGVGTGFSGSGIALDSMDVLAAAHEGTGINFVGDGTNYAYSPGQHSNVSDVVQYPGYTGDFNTSVDLEIIHLITPLTQANGQPIPSLTIAPPPAAGTIFQGSGFGRHGLYSDSAWYLDGNLRAWNTPVSDISDFNPSTNFVSDFGVFDTNIPVNGNAYLLDSGGGDYYTPPSDLTSPPELIGMLVGGTQPPSEVMVGVNVILYNFEGWIQSNDINGSVPEPNSLAVLGLVACAALARRSCNAYCRTGIRGILNGTTPN